MASKQLGKLRQWAGEVMATKEKTMLPEDFIELEKEVEMTRHGLESLQLSSSDYHAYISRKIPSEGARGGEDKLMHTEALGVVMVNYGQELGDDSDFGKSLISYGRARSRVGAIQETYAVHLMEAFINHLNRSLVELEEYSGLRKKLDSRRLALDAAISKAEKTYKKEKDRKEAQDELEKAQLRYEKVCEDVQFRMDTIKANEALHLEELSGLLDAETKFVEEYLSILNGIRAEWPDGRDPRKTPRASTFNRRESTSTTTERDGIPSSSRFSSYKSSKTNGSRRSLPSDWHSSESDAERAEKPPTRPTSRLSKKSGKAEPPSRPQSRASRKRHDSVATTASITADDIEQPKPVKPRRKSMVSSLGDAMSNVMSRGKGRDKENFSALQDDDDDGNEIERPRSSMSTRSARSGKSHGDSDEAKSKPAKGRKMRALYDFTGSTDELSFKAGDEIYVLQEVLDDWWMGEAHGKRGLFPSNYAVLITATDEGVRKPQSTRPSRTPSTSNVLAFGIASISRGSKVDNTDESRRTLVNGTDTEFSSDGESESDAGGVHAHSRVFADEHRVDNHDDNGLGHVVTATDNSAMPPASSRQTSDADYHVRLTSALLAQAMASNRQTSSDESSTNLSSPTKRMPPPPPPRRTPTSGALAPPPLPARNMSSRSQSTTSLQPPLAPLMAEGLNRKANSDTSSPFDSENQSLNSFDAVALSTSSAKCKACGCQEFHDDPFRGSSLCTNCGHPHIR